MFFRSVLGGVTKPPKPPLDLSQHSRHECKSQCNCFLYPLSGIAEGSNITLLINMILTIPQGLVATKKDNPLLKGNEKVYGL